MSTVVEPRPPASPADRLSEYEYRVDGREKVTGQAKYSADFEMPGMLWAAFTRSTSPHAKIVSIDTSAAKAMKGVHAVLTGADIGDKRFGRRLADYPVLAFEKVRFIGELVAAVAAETPEIARKAADAIEVEYQELPAILDPHESLADDAPILHENPEGYRYNGKERPPVPHKNAQGHHIIAKGEGKAGEAKADRIVEQTFTTPRIYAAYIEPRATLVWIDGAGIVHVVSTNKAPFSLRDQLAVVSGLPKTSVVVEPSSIGGDFGGKGLSIEEFPCYFLAKATNRPVKHVRSHVDDIGATTTRHASHATFRTGVTADGRIVSFTGRMIFDGGAYAAGKNSPALMAGAPRTPYRIPHVHLERFTVYTNAIPGGSVRAPGDIQFYFAFESHIDSVARELGIDPWEFRRKNALAGDKPDIDGIPHMEPRAVEVLDSLRTAARWGDPLPPGRGRGISLCVRHIGGGNTSLKMLLEPSGSVVVRTGTTDQGTGAFTVVHRVVYADLGLPPERVRVERGSTNDAPEDPGAGGSKITHIVGQAALDGTRQLRERLEATACEVAGAAAGTMALRDGAFVSKDGRSRVSWDDAVKAALRGGPVEIVGNYVEHHDHDAHVHSFSAYMVELSVDRETGEVTIHDVLFVLDGGTIINPLAHRGQINGGFIFGIGHAMFEELRMEDGKPVNASFADYKVPTQADVPPLRVVLLKADGPGPWGAKMAGEVSTPGVAPAIANAIADACGARVTDMPLTAERILETLGELQPA